MNQWKLDNKEVTPEDYERLTAEGYIGFVYLITNTQNGMKYIGKKLWQTTRKLPPLKGKKRRRTKIVETDWRDYYGSSDNVKQTLAESGPDIFTREILILCKSKGELSYLEAKEQFDRGVLLKPEEYYNGIIQLRINRRAVLNSDIINNTI